MSLRAITKFVIPISEIPLELSYKHWIIEYPKHSFVEVHIDGEEKGDNSICDWIVKKYPELVDQDSFFIHIDIPKDEQIN